MDYIQQNLTAMANEKLNFTCYENIYSISPQGSHLPSTFLAKIKNPFPPIILNMTALVLSLFK